ncbi:unnamed protein product [Linum tenue]|uniref:Bromo domain-containing protein n=1 Tax=Linum tenue TaxID=586396 RepID=A0AAV0IU43_9ROSI|nr:unnamed protein product [Linum tenue]
MKSATSWSIRDGRSTGFWTHPWLDNNIILEEYLLADLSEEDRLSPVAFWINDEGDWDWPRLRGLLPVDILALIAEDSRLAEHCEKAKENVARAQRTAVREDQMLKSDGGPPGRLIQVQTDGSVHPNTKQAAAGGLLRDHLGRCVEAFVCNPGSCSVTRDELRGATEGLKRAWTRGYRKVELNLDSSTAIAIIKGGSYLNVRHGLAACQIGQLIDRDWDISVNHVNRESNVATDFLANKGHSYPFGSHYFDALPLEDLDESPAFTQSAASDDASSINRRPNDLNTAGFVTFNISSYSRKELVELKDRFVAELEQIRQLKSRIDLPLDFQIRSSSNFHNKKLIGGPNSNKKILGSKRPFPVTGSTFGAQDFKRAQHPDNSQLMKKCVQILSKLMKHKFGHIFNAPMDVVGIQLHDYHDIIKVPMDLGMVKKKLARNLYDSPQDFAADVRLTFNNTMRYNPKGHDELPVNERMGIEYEAKKPKKGDAGEEDVDIGDEMPMSSFPLVR